MRALSALTLTLTILSALTLRVNPASEFDMIYIRADGSIDPPDAPITTDDNITYTFTANIRAVSIIVQRDDIVIDGHGYTLQATIETYGSGIFLMGRENVTVRNITIMHFQDCISLVDATKCTIHGNIMMECYVGVWVFSSSNNTIFNNTIVDVYPWVDIRAGILLQGSSFNTILRNNLTNIIFPKCMY